jgi:hypothetical protein
MHILRILTPYWNVAARVLAYSSIRRIAMKIKDIISPGRLCIAVTATSVLIALSMGVLSVRADDDDDEDQEREHCYTRIRLHATAEAPAHAAGSARLRAHQDDGVATASVQIHARHLSPGVYTVTLFNVAQDNSAVLGSFMVRTHDEDDDDEDEDADNDDQGEDNDDQGDDDDEGEARFAVPSSLSVGDLGRLSITDANGVEVLFGDFSLIQDIRSGWRNVQVLATAGEVVPESTGLLTIRARARRGHSHGTFSLRGYRLPANTELVLTINGHERGTVHANSRGRLRIRKSHRSVNLFRINSVRVQTAEGDTVLKADF